MLLNNSMLMNGQTLNEYALQFWDFEDVFSDASMMPLNRLKRHKSFVDAVTLDSLQMCRRRGIFLPDQSAVCNFVAKYPSCTNIVQRINYLKLMICGLNIGFDPGTYIFMILISAVIIAIYTLFAYVVGKYFILPNVIYIASYINVPSFEYGVTTIGVLIAAPDLITNIGVCSKWNANGTLILSGMMGRALSCYVVGMATIAFHQRQCTLPGVRFARSLLMILATNVFTVASLYYKLYNDNDPLSSQSNFNIKYCASFMIIFYVAFITFVILLSRREDRRRTEFEEIKPRKTYAKVVPKELTGIHLYTYPLNPFHNIARSKWCVAVLTPFWILSAFQVPVVDQRRPLNGWSKYLACTSILIFPFQIWMSRAPEKFFYLVVFVTVVASLMLFAFTSPTRIPRYHGLFAIIGIVIGFSLYHVIDLQVNVLLYQVLAWTADLHLDITTSVAFSTCFIIFTIIISHTLMVMRHPNLASGVVVGISMNQSFTALPCIIFQTCYNLHVQVSVSSHTLTCFVFLMVTIGGSLLSAWITKFHWRPAHGVFLIVFYIFFLTTILLGGYEVIHPYGTHHAVTDIFDTEHSTWA